MGKLFGERLKDARKAKRMTLQEIADALGVSLNTVWRWEAGRQSPPDDQKKLIANILDVSVSYLLGEVEVIKSGMVEVKLFDLLSGTLVEKGTQLMPSILTTATTILVRDGEATYFIDEASNPTSGQRALLDIGGRVTIQRIVFQGERIQVGGTVLDKESVIIMGRVKGVYQK
jgi:transcriptional regulator with XRE-family HTH domain